MLPAEQSARLVADTGSGEALPLLAFTLHQLATGHGRGDTLSDRDYERLGGVHGALGRQADAALTAASAASGLSEPQILTRLVGLATIDDAGRYSRRRLPRDPTDTTWDAAVAVFVDHRLLTTDTGQDGSWITVTHEALLTAWPPLAAALSEHADQLRAYRSVEQAATEWKQAGQADHYLWDADRLSAALPAPSTTDPHTTGLTDALSGDGRAFLKATRRHVAAARHRRRRRLTAAFTALSVLLVTALIAAGIAVIQQRQARSAQAVALARSLTIQAQVAQATDPRLALQLALAAHHINPSLETTSILTTTVAATHYVPLGQPLTGHTRPVSSVAFSADGKTLASGSVEGTVRLWDVTDPTMVRPLGQPLTGHTGSVWSVAFSADGKTLATGSFEGTVRLWDVTDPKTARPLGQALTGHTGPVSVAFSAVGKTLASASADGTVRLWDLSPVAELQVDPVRVACSLSRTGLTRDEWELYVPGFSYHDICAPQ